MPATVAVLVYGAGSGLGKSTLARAFVKDLEARGVSVRLFAEESVLELPAFRSYVRGVQGGRAGDIATLLACCDAFIAEVASSGAEVVVLDSLLPCWDWLHSARAGDDVVGDFTDRLRPLLSRLRPVLVLVEGDMRRALDRAIESRGTDWALDLAELRAGRRDRDSLEAYFVELRNGTERAMQRWTYPVVKVDTVTRDLASVLRELASHFRTVLREDQMTDASTAADEALGCNDADV